MEEQKEVSGNGIRREVTASAVTVDKVYTADFQKEGTKSAQLRQTVITKSFYPSKQITSSHQGNPFNLAEFGFEEQEFENKENRVAWIDIPAIITSKTDVEAKIPSDAVLYRMMGNRPILTTNQLYSIEANQKSMDDYANSQIVRFGEGHEKAGQIVLDTNQKPQYRAIFYSNTAKEDIDQRTEQAEDFYASDQIKAEMVGAQVVAEQKL